MDELTLQVLRLSLPLVLAALGEVLCERAGVLNLGIEGMMLAGAFSAWGIAAGGNESMLFLGCFGALGVGAMLGSLSACFIVLARCDAIVTGTAIHFLCVGGTGLLFERWKTSASVLTFAERSPLMAAIPYATTLLLVLGAWIFLSSTALGLKLRAAGESPFALRAAGGSERRMRFLALVLAGAVSGIAGASLTTVLTGEFVEGMTGGRGFLALCLVIFARWHPLGVLLSGLLLGAAFVAELHLTTSQAASAGSASKDAVVFLLRCLPYAVTLAALTWIGPGRLRAPAALSAPVDDLVIADPR